jgi:DNA-binding Xre family transcriptional regulator
MAFQSGRGYPATMQGMTRITDNFVSSSSLVESELGALPVVAAKVGDVQIVLHARKLRGGRSLREAADLVGLNRDELSRIEKGNTLQIRFETIAKLLSGYGCHLEDLIEVKSLPQESAKPLYEQAMSYMSEYGEIGDRPTRRAVRRSLELDVQSEEDRAAFIASTAPSELPGRRRSALKARGL